MNFKCTKCKTEIMFSIAARVGTLSTNDSAVMLHHSFPCPTCKEKIEYTTIMPCAVHEWEAEE